MSWTEDWNTFINYELPSIGGVTVSVKHLLYAVLVLAFTFLCLKILRRMILKPRFIIDKIDVKKRNSVFLIIKFIGWVFAVFLALGVMGFNITGLLVGSTALLIGLGFGVQNIFKDFVSGLFILFEGSLKIGDIVEVDGVVGKVVEINFRSSEVLTRDDVTIIIPNSKFIAENVTNWSIDNENVRFEIKVSVAYGSNVDEVYECLEGAMQENQYISSSPGYFVRFKNFGESALEFEMIFWSRHGFRIENVKSDLRRKVYKDLSKRGLSIPFPQRDIHIKGIERFEDSTKKPNNTSKK